MFWNRKKTDIPSLKEQINAYKTEQRDAEKKETYSTPLLFNPYNNKNATGLSAFNAATNLISNSIAQLPINVKERKDGKSDIVDNSPITALFYNIKRLTKFTAIKKLIEDVIIHGNGFMYIKRNAKGEPIELKYLRASAVVIHYNDYMDELYYIVSYTNDIKHKVMPEDMIHLILHSNDGVQGISIINYAKRTLALANATESSASDYFSSGCSIKGIIQLKTPIATDKQKADIRNAWNTVHGGDNGSGVAVLSGVEDFKKLSDNADDAQMLETRQYNVIEIARFFNISPVLLGDLSHSSYNDIESAQIAFVTQTLLPFIAMCQDEFTRKLIKVPNQYVNLDENELLKSNKLNMANYITTLTKNGVLTINEGRRLLGYNAIEGADDLMIPYTDTNQNKINQNNDE